MTDLMELTLARPMYHRAHDYFGVWAMLDTQLNGLVELIAQTDLQAHEQAAAERQNHLSQLSPDERKAMREAALQAEAATLSEMLGLEFQAADSGLMVASNGLAIIDLYGTLMKAQSSLASGTSTTEVRRKVRAAANDPKVSAVLYRIDSPGGAVAGTQELADDMARLQKKIPTAAQVEDLAASAGYWLAAQAGTVAMNRAGMAGSIGVFSVVQDSSGRAEDMKVKVHVVKSGAHKGAGTPGTAITDEHLAHWQERVNSLHALFSNAVETGRGMSAKDVAAVADGRVFVGEDAKSVGLVDAIQSMDETIAQLMERAKPKSQVSVAKGLDEMSATLAELKDAMPAASADFILGQLEASATLVDALKAHAKHSADLLKAKDEQIKEAKAEAKATDGKKRGVEPFEGNCKKKGGSKDDGESAEETIDNPKVQWDALKAKYLAEHPDQGPAQAGAALARKHPELHIAYLEATQYRKSAKVLLEDRVEDLAIQ